MNHTMQMLLIGVLIVFTACQTPGPQQLTDAEKQVIKSEINKRFDGWMKGVRNADLDEIMNFVAEDYMVASNGKLMRSRTEVITASRPYFDSHVKQDVTNEDPVITVLSAELAIQAWNGTLAATNTEGVTSEPKVAAVTAVWAKQKGDWFVIQVHESFVCMNEGDKS